MRIEIYCGRHDLNLTGNPELVEDGELVEDEDGELVADSASWSVDTSGMSCPQWTVLDECQADWKVVVMDEEE